MFPKTIVILQFELQEFKKYYIYECMQEFI